MKKYEWIVDPETGSAELVESSNFNQLDGMPKDERTLIGGVTVVEEVYYCAWALNNLDKKVQIRARIDIEEAKCDVEEVLMRLKRLPNQLTQRPARHEKAA